jgi:hypothetical protein
MHKYELIKRALIKKGLTMNTEPRTEKNGNADETQKQKVPLFEKENAKNLNREVGGRAPGQTPIQNAEDWKSGHGEPDEQETHQ